LSRLDFAPAYLVDYWALLTYLLTSPSVLSIPAKILVLVAVALVPSE
jgi:hypothetical protein